MIALSPLSFISQSTMIVDSQYINQRMKCHCPMTVKL